MAHSIVAGHLCPGYLTWGSHAHLVQRNRLSRQGSPPLQVSRLARRTSNPGTEDPRPFPAAVGPWSASWDSPSVRQALCPEALSWAGNALTSLTVAWALL